MQQPSLDLLMEKVESKYTLVVATAKHARHLMETLNHEGCSKGAKPVSIALEEIVQGKVRIEQLNE
ncbi:MAG: DNA-directed RNA polymerase subunit omega [Desulfitobacteriaceae bacterium]|nr:DNA-directed RNA polymerase subunit omega [Desulfitobacteriaceae bacterium]MDD4345659.1 DNA-directed RNA polymerase subunit omega [Desulfitobacteriaceae bacterium]MDD4400529.1 DNA-directed RNA polymerase subunit omega [Desulfitobacteriaceae bacterium]